MFVMNLFNEYRVTGKTSFMVNPDGPIDVIVTEYYVGNGMGHRNRVYFVGTLEDFNTFKGYCALLGYTGIYHHVTEGLHIFLSTVPTKYFFSTPSYMNEYSSIFSFY